MVKKEKAPVLTRTESKKKPTIFVSNLPFEVSEGVVRDALWEAAKIDPEHVELLTKSLSGGRAKTCGLAVVTMHTEADVQKALTEADGKLVLGRPMILRLDKFVGDDPNYEHHDVVPAAKTAAAK